MKLFFWRNKAVDEFAKALADEFFSNVQPGLAKDYFANVPQENIRAGKKKKSTVDKYVQTERWIENMVLKVQQFLIIQKLGVYGKAKLHLVFMERLKELGYADDVAKQLDRIILLQAP